MKNYKNISLFFKGFVMGIAEVIPGVSGSTLALVLKIYSDFISFLYQISNFLKELVLFFMFRSSLEKTKKIFKEIDITFGIFLFAGMSLAILLFSNLMAFLFEEHREYVLAFFFGLVLASVSVPWNLIKEKSAQKVLLCFVTFVLFFLFLSLKPIVMLEVPHPLYFFFGGAVAICAMVLPGISGSFVFLMIGLYEFIVNHVSNLTKLQIATNEIFNLISLAFGIVFGFSIFVRILQNALKNHSATIYAILTGIMLASLRVLWVDFTETAFLPLTALVGFGVLFFLKKLG